MAKNHKKLESTQGLKAPSVCTISKMGGDYKA